MSDIAIRVEHLSKLYHIGARQERYRTLRDQIAQAVTAPLRRATKLLRGQATGAAELDETIWALKDVSFEIKRGEVVGIIGRNGAGKTTLLKILSRITEPTEGRAEIHGRVGSLLEVGTGFHPELTGRENIYLNGAILGMKKAEIDKKFDEIVAFAEVEKFIDTPVKHYSSGMYVRLAFAVAAHLDPEILLVDEVLAVGDAAFQKKCLGKMGDVAREGRTVLFVSHNMASIQTLCRRAMWIESGSIVTDGGPSNVVERYLEALEQHFGHFLSKPNTLRGGGTLVFQESVVHGQSCKPGFVRLGDTVKFLLEIGNRTSQMKPCRYIGISIYDNMGYKVTSFNTRMKNTEIIFSPFEAKRISITVPRFSLAPGIYRYSLLLRSTTDDIEHMVEDAGTFRVIEDNFFKTGFLPRFNAGVVYFDFDLQIEDHVEQQNNDRPSTCY